MKITEFENEEALDLLADVMDPISVICADEEVKNCKSKLKAVQIILKKYKKEIITVLARMNNTPVSEYKCNLITITRDLMELLNEFNGMEDIMSVFQS